MKHIIIISIFLMFFSCKKQNSSSIDIQIVNMYSYDELLFDSLVSDIECFTLKSNTSNRYCWKVIEKDSLLYIYSLSDMCVSIYKKNGDLIRNIVNYKQGYVMKPCDILINKENNQLWIIEEQENIYKYTLTGELIEKQTLPFPAVKIAQIDKESYIFYDGGFDKSNPFNIRWASDNNFNKTKSFIPKYLKNFTAIPISIFASYKEMIYILLPYNDMIYYYDNKSNAVEAMIKLDFQGDFLSHKDMPVEGYRDKEFAELIQKNEKIYSIEGFHCIDNILFIRLRGGDNAFRAVNTDNNKVYKFNSLIDGIRYSPQGSNENSLLLVLRHEEVRGYYSEKNKKSRYESVNKMLDSLKDDDGLVVFKINLKKTKL